MRRFVPALLLFGPMLAGCGGDDDGEGGGSSGTTGTSGSGGTSGTGGTGAGATGGSGGSGAMAGGGGGSGGGSGGMGGAGGTGAGGEAPVINLIEWTHDPACAPALRSDVTFVITVTDADTPNDQLAFSGSVSGCTGSLDAATSAVSCPEAGQYFGNVEVTDPQGNFDEVTDIIVNPCKNDSHTP